MAIHLTRVMGRRRIRNESTATMGISTWEKTTHVIGGELFQDDEADVILHEVDERGDGESEVALVRERLANLGEEVGGPRGVALVATLDDARERRDGEDELEELSLRRRAW